MLDVKKAIWIDNEGYWNFGSDQVNINYPVRFPTVTISLESTLELDKHFDDMRVEAGYLPMLYPDGWTEEMGYDGVVDPDGWYNFYIGLNGFTDTMVDNCIMGVVESPNAEDNEQEWYLPISEAEQIAIYHEIDRQLKERFGTSCEELLEEARQEMIELEEYEAKYGKA